jgi:DNA helicase-2/ATP-dependent DNA helicase PcrA
MTAPTPSAPPLTLARPTPAPVSFASVTALLKGLNPEQRRAVTHGDGPLLVLAGPGTGKTNVITRRICWLVATKRARPSEILALTFTDKAADEMQARVDELVPYGYNDAAVHTFHAWGDRLVREFAFELGLPSDARVLSRADAVMFLRERLFELGLQRYRPLGDPTRFLGALVALFSRAKDESVSVDDYRLYAERRAVAATLAAADADTDERREAAAALAEDAAAQLELAAAYGHYQRLLGEAGCLDFGDQVSLALRLLRDHPQVRAELAARHRYILVDEFQDTNPAQLDLVTLLAGSTGNVTVVGDDDQSIYTFRGAAMSNVLGFSARYPSARQVVLRRNYRSRRPIIDAAYRLIRHNDPARLESRAGLDKRLSAARRARGGPVVERGFATVSEEADWVAKAIAERVRDGARPRDHAILVRANADAEPFQRSLNVEGIAWRFSGASGLYSRPEVRELLAFLRVVADLDATVDLYALATGEPYGLGGPDLTALLEYARRRHRSLWAVAREVLDQPGLVRLQPQTRHALARLVADLTAASDLAHRRPSGEVLYDHLKRSGRLTRLLRGERPSDDEVLQNIARFFEIVRRRARLLPEDRVTFLAPHFAAAIEAGDDPATADLDDDLDAVAIVTVHKAKGLEFPVVFVPGLVDGRFPSRGRREPLALPTGLVRDEQAGLDEQPYAEERRLCYVAMTRARDELFLTWAAESGTGRQRRPSPFIAEALDLAVPPSVERAGPRREILEQLEPRAEDVATTPARAAPPGATEPLTLSFSHLDDYLSCPRKFQLRHVLRVPVPSHHALVYGSALHQAVAAYGQRHARGRPMSEDELLEVFAAHWRSEGFVSREHEEARFEAGRETLRRFHAAQTASEAAPPIGVEQEFSFELEPGLRLRGRIDRVDAEPDGVVITDFKSSDVRDPRKARDKTRDSLQLQIYAMAHEQSTGTLPAAVQLHFLDSGAVGRVAPDPARLAKARERIGEAAAGIRAEAWQAKPDFLGCGYCPFRDICPDSKA